MLKHIAIAGNIGCGKTTLAAKLGKHYGWQVLYESVDNNPYLRDFYEDMRQWAFHLQIYFLNSRFKQLNQIRASGITTVQDRTIYEDAHIFAANLFKNAYLSERDYKSYLDLFQSMVEFVKPPDLLIYLRADIPKLVEQIQKRGRDYENTMRLDYLTSLNEHYEEWIASYNSGKLLIVDVNKIDFVNNTEDFSMIVSKIDLETNSLFS